VRKPVANHSFNDADQTRRGISEIVQQIIGNGH
jgi:hypothetical protein